MRKLSPLATFNRVWCQLPPEQRTAVSTESYLAAMAAKEAPMLRDFVRWADADRTTYDENVFG